ncbi:MAG TPA: hypothetical protein VGJ19_23190 [Streptosporangiaceae bacterium]
MIGSEADSPAARALQDVQAFAATADREAGQDELGSREQAAAWLQAAGLPERGGGGGRGHRPRRLLRTVAARPPA